MSLGFKNPNFVSAISGRGVADFLDRLTANLSTVNNTQQQEEIINVAIVGRPNVGKSTLLNTLVGKEKAIVSEIPGTTRDTTDAVIDFKNQKIQFVDTAGIRRRGKIDRQIEKYSVIRAYRAIKNSSVVVVLLDGIEGITNQDAHLVGFAKDQGKSIIIAVNKVDAWPDLKEKFPTIRPVADVEIPTTSSNAVSTEFRSEHRNVGKKMAEAIYLLQKNLAFLPFAPVVFVSAKDGTNLNILLKKILEVYSARFFSIPEPELRILVDEIQTANQQLPQILEFRQEKTNPPIFKLLVKNKKRFHFSFIRFIENRLRDRFPYPGTPVFIDLIERTQKPLKPSKLNRDS